MGASMNRREFLRRTAATGTAMAAGSVAAGCATGSANEKGPGREVRNGRSGRAPTRRTERRRTQHVRVVEASVEFVERSLRTPLVLSTGAITKITQATASVRVEDPTGRTGDGRGAIYLSDLWSWPTGRIEHPERDRAMRLLCKHIADALPGLANKPAHAIDHGMALEHAVDEWCGDVSGELKLPEPVPRLAGLVCLSPFDAAIHDAYGRLLGISSYRALGREFFGRDLSCYLGKRGRGRYLDEFIRTQPRARLTAWIIVGKSDALTEAGVADDAPDDGVPNSLEGWVRGRGIHAFKLKLAGKDNVVDVERTRDVYRAARRLHDELRSGARIRLTVDTNESNPDPASVVDYLERLRQADPQTYAALDYLEQPTERDLTAHRFDMRPVAVRKPVLVDEGIRSLESLDIARELGWSGLALKTCKGHSAALLCVAWAELCGCPYSLQDLTNPGIAAIHAAGFAAHTNTINGVELNSPQFTPEANADQLAAHPGLFRVTGGEHRVETLGQVGLGY